MMIYIKLKFCTKLQNATETKVMKNDKRLCRSNGEILKIRNFSPDLFSFSLFLDISTFVAPFYPYLFMDSHF